MHYGAICLGSFYLTLGTTHVLLGLLGQLLGRCNWLACMQLDVFVHCGCRKNELEERMLLNLSKKAWAAGLVLQNFQTHHEGNEKVVKELKNLADRYDKVCMRCCCLTVAVHQNTLYCEVSECPVHVNCATIKHM